MMVRQVACTAVSIAAIFSGACYDPNRVTAPDDVLMMTANPPSIPADGFSRSQITIRVQQGTRRDLAFTFKNEGGTLSTPASQERGPDGNGEISVFLKSDTSPRTALVTVEAKDGDTVVVSHSVTVTFTTPAPSSVVRLTGTPTQVEADGVSSIQLRADVNPSVATRTVTFKTTNGTFDQGAESPLRETSRDTNADGGAVIQLYGSGQVGTAVVTATAGGFSDTQTVNFTPLTLRLSVSSSSVEADGVSSIQLRVETPAGVSRNITFTTTNGSFARGANPPVRTLPDQATGADGVAIAQLYAADDVGTAVVTATAGGFSDSETVNFTPLTLRLSVSPSSVQADGVSSIQLRVETPAGVNRNITFTTTNGSFEQGANPPVRRLADQATGAGGVLITQLYAPDQAGTAVVTATSGGFSDSETVTFVRAEPDFISLSAQPLTIPRTETDSTTVTATLSRRSGSVSDNALVEFSVVSDVTGASFGRFEQITRSREGVATAKFTAGESAPAGLATITARVPGTSVSAQTKITIAQ